MNQFVLEDLQVVFNDNAIVRPTEWKAILDGQIQDFSLTPDQHMPFDMTMAFDSGGALSLNGQVQFLSTFQVNADMQLGNFDVTLLQPYVTGYADIEMVKGNLTSTAEILRDAEENFGFTGEITFDTFAVEDLQMKEQLLSVSSLNVNQITISHSKQSIAIAELLFKGLYTRIIIDA